MAKQKLLTDFDFMSYANSSSLELLNSSQKKFSNKSTLGFSNSSQQKQIKVLKEGKHGLPEKGKWTNTEKMSFGKPSLEVSSAKQEKQRKVSKKDKSSSDKECITLTNKKNDPIIKRSRKSKSSEEKSKNQSNLLKIFKEPKKEKCLTSKKKTESKSKKVTLKRSDSFEKYGLILPSDEKMIENNLILEKNKKLFEAFDQIEDIVDIDLSLSPQRASVKLELKDCKHLKDDELKSMCVDNFSYAEDIVKGKIFSRRHQMYKQNAEKNFRCLTYNTSMHVFDYSQIKLLVKLLSEKFGTKDDFNDQYVFQVLLPEICLKIFMHVHAMDKDEATMYLENRPLEDDSD